MKEKTDVTAWQALEYVYRKKHPMWYVLAITIVALGMFDAYLANNVLFAALIFIGGSIMIAFSSRKPRVLSIEMGQRGVMVDGKLHQFNLFLSFWLIEKKHENLLLLSPKKTWAQQLIIPLGDTDLDKLQEILLEHLPEEEDCEPLSHRLLEYLGF